MERTTIKRKGQVDRGRILILEDDVNREIWFRQQFIGWDYDYVSTVAEAIDLLLKNEYAYIFLDMDLEDSHYSWTLPRKEETSGYQAALFLEKFPSRSANAQIIIHSCNRTESEKSVYALQSRKARHVPFPKLKETMRVQ